MQATQRDHLVIRERMAQHIRKIVRDPVVYPDARDLGAHQSREFFYFNHLSVMLFCVLISPPGIRRNYPCCRHGRHRH